MACCTSFSGGALMAHFRNGPGRSGVAAGAFFGTSRAAQKLWAVMRWPFAAIIDAYGLFARARRF